MLLCDIWNDSAKDTLLILKYEFWRDDDDGDDGDNDDDDGDDDDAHCTELPWKWWWFVKRLFRKDLG